MTDRDENGRFVNGHKSNGGRPSREREERYYEILLSTVSFEDWKRIIQKAKDQAIKGSATARKFLADYFVGPPIQRNEHSGEGGGPLILKVIRDMESGSRIPDPSTNAARKTSGDKD
jgi:hypothetical protein